MAAKLIRQPDQLALVGAPTSAAAAAAGVERGPAALRAAGVVERLSAAGFQVADVGDPPPALFQEDPENPRARNLGAVLPVLDALRARVEQAVRTHALPIVLGGDATVALALVAGLRRQVPSIALIHFGRRADLRTPTRTDDGLLESMTVSHLVGQGAAEMVRFWRDPPLVREPDLVLFGLEQPDEIDAERLGHLAVRSVTLTKIRDLGATAAAEGSLEVLRAAQRDFVVHLGWEVFSSDEMPGCRGGLAGGLSIAEVCAALDRFAAQPRFAGLSISGYDPALDSEGRGARAAVELLAGAFAARHAALLQPTTAGPSTPSAETSEPAPEPRQEPPVAESADGTAEHGESEPPAPPGGVAEPAPLAAVEPEAASAPSVPEGSEMTAAPSQSSASESLASPAPSEPPATPDVVPEVETSSAESDAQKA